MKTLKEINDSYESIIRGEEPERTALLNSLMEAMEIEFDIPIERDETWEKENRAINAMYRKISISRITR